jgi:hypothetical protein
LSQIREEREERRGERSVERNLLVKKYLPSPFSPSTLVSGVSSKPSPA